jgi:hypothetical protein
MGISTCFHTFPCEDFVLARGLRNGSQWNEKMFFFKKKLSGIQLLLKISTFANRF